MFIKLPFTTTKYNDFCLVAQSKNHSLLVFAGKKNSYNSFLLSPNLGNAFQISQEASNIDK